MCGEKTRSYPAFACSARQKSSMTLRTTAPFGCHRMSPGPMSSVTLNRSSSRPILRWSRFLISSRIRRCSSSSFFVGKATP